MDNDPKAVRNADNDLKVVKKALNKVPEGLPDYLRMLCAAAYLHEAGRSDVTEHSLSAEGLPCHALIFAPVFISNDETGEIGGQVPLMFEIRVNYLVTIQEAAKECGVTYRTIQRWRDDNEIFPITKEGKQFFPSEIVKEVARQKGHI